MEIYTQQKNNKRIGVPTTSVAKALQLLLIKNFIEEAGKGTYRVIHSVYNFILAEQHNDCALNKHAQNDFLFEIVWLQTGDAVLISL